MAYQIYFTGHFRNLLKPYLKKYRHIREDVVSALRSFDKRQAASLGAQTYKVRVHSQDIPRGKSHAFRMIVLVIELDSIISPVVLYFKGDQESIDKENVIYHALLVKKELALL